MKPVVRSAVAVLGGILVGMFVIAGLEYVASLAFPPPEGLNPRDPADLAQIVAAAPIGPRVLVVAAWTIGTFVGAYVAVRYATRAPALHGRIVTAIILVATVFNLAQLPHPLWMWVIGPLGVILGGLGGTRSAASAPPVAKPAY